MFDPAALLTCADRLHRRAGRAAIAPRRDAPPAHSPSPVLSAQHGGGIPHFQARGERRAALLPAQPDP